MGYELVFYFHEEISKGEYNKEEVKKKSVKVGSPYEEVPLELVAGKIIAQLARRNILVVDVDIFELTKKKLSYKETSDGILIKNKKFSFDDGAIITVNSSEYEESVEDSPSSIFIEKPQQPEAKNVLDASKISVLRYEVYDPEVNDLAQYAKDKGYKLTPKKSYPIISEVPARRAYNYVVVDDTGKKITVSSLLFVVELNVEDDTISGKKSQSNDIDLSFGNTVDDEMVNLR